MVMSGHVWSCQVTSGHVWSCLDMSCQVMSGHVMSGHVWSGVHKKYIIHVIVNSVLVVILVITTN